ncbi:autotransporter secretion inner membrane protein TamB [Kaistia soli DSM 19436]|uniref:Autotransporter secretion inner membrane protein TamB n=1 Tax=Kaistia soli DSM 19436 TaxID=1122133 RepID=A0A1M4X246_9HYPH|nr:translocation/assembly module TamB domain-containing protein [Kaistia soli]SHE87578.1 autotransporter secretion inner membrane protein TamB [Kaistia soli DSM 19436]
MRIARILIGWLGIVLIGLIIALVAAFALIQTTPGKRMLADLASRLASRDGLTVEISDLTGFVPTDMRVGQIAVSDTRGQFVTLGGLELIWHPLALLSGTINVERLSADRVALDRLPVLPPTEPLTTTSGSTIPALRVVLGKLHVGEIVLGEPVAGMAAQLSLDASARLVDPAEGLDLDFAVERTDAPGTLRGSIGYAPSGGKNVLALDVTASEPAGGLVARVGRIEGLPPLSLTVKGSAPLDDWNGTLALDAGPSGQLAGTAAVRRIADARRVMLDLGGTIDGLLPANVRPLFSGHTSLIGSAVVADDFNTTLEGLNLTAAGFGLALLGSIDPSRETADLTFDLVGGDASHFASLAPGMSWKGWRLNAHLVGPFGLPAVDATLAAEDLSGRGYGAQTLNMTLKGTPADSALAVVVDGKVAGLTSDLPKVAAALGTSATFSASASISANVQTLTAATLKLSPLELAFVGTAGPTFVKGNFKLPRLDLAAFASLTDRPLSGTVSLEGAVDTGKDFSAVSLNIDGTAKDVHAGIDALDGFLAGTSRFKGALARAADGTIAVRDLTLAANGIDLAVNGGIATDTADLNAKLTLADLGRLDPRVKGGAKAELNFTGGLAALGLKGRVDIASAEAMGKPIRDLAVTLDLADLTGKPNGSFALDGRIADRPAKGGARFATETDSRRIDDLDLSVGSVRATGSAAVGANNIVTGRFTVAATDLSDLAPLILTQISGRLDGTVVLDAVNGQQLVAINGRAQNISVAGNRLESADIDLRAVDPAGTPVLDGRVTLAGFVAGAQRIDRATLTAASRGQSTDLTLDTAVLGATLAARANITPAGAATRIRLDQLRMARGPTTVTLSAPATITLADGGVAIDRLQLATGGGGATIAGRVGQTLDLTADIRNLPLSIAGLFVPNLDPRGTLSGSARITGSATAPAGNYDIRVAGLSTADLATKGIGPFQIGARGTLAGGRVNVDATIDAPSVSGLTVRGSVPIAAGALDLRVAGTIDLGIANTFLADQGSTVRGRANVDMTLRGTSAAPAASGTIRVAGATFVDSVNGVSLSNIQAVLTGSNSQIVVSQLTAATPRGGTLSGSGSIGLDAARGFPANVRIELNRANILASDLMNLVASGKIAIEGPVATRPRIAGNIDVIRLDINIADQLSGGGLDPLQVRHVNTGGEKRPSQKGLRAQAQTRAAATAARTARRAEAPPAFVADLDLTIAARNAVFVRGMGIDAEFGGNLTLRGTTANMVTLGGFELRRGRFDLLGRRLDFTDGKVTFEGSTDPALDFTASTTTSDVTASIIVTGRASAPTVSFTSSPALAQDEVLSRILFGRSISTLNASQALQVAQAVAQFSGGGPGVLDKVRRSLGVDSFDVDATGQVGIGKRLNDRVYVGARQGPNANSGKVTVDVDVTRNIRLQGAAGGDGSGELGIGAQWDY